MGAFVPNEETHKRFRKIIILHVEKDQETDNEPAEDELRFQYGQGTSMEGLGMDSLDQVDSIMEVEEEFEIEIADEPATVAENLDDIFELIAWLLEETEQIPQYLMDAKITPVRKVAKV